MTEMPRKYERNPKAPPRRQWNLENLREAKNRLKAGEIGLREASRYYSIPTRTLKRRWDKNDMEEKSLGRSKGKHLQCRISADTQEEKLVLRYR
ncbi:hypothetical protein C0J52_14363 [Blattella germanica]|nr:hypothetical protein C0J52_14363 [Blattella germanica]